MLSMLENLFRGRRVKLSDLREALKSVERDRRRVRTEMRRWERQRQQIMNRLKKSRQSRNQVEVDYLWDELKSHRTTGNDLRQEARVHNLEAIALKRSVRALEQAERTEDRVGAQRLLDRVQGSGVLERLAVHRDSQAECLKEMSSLLQEFGDATEDEGVDPEKAMFLAELDSISDSEGGDDSPAASGRELELLERFQSRADPEAE